MLKKENEELMKAFGVSTLYIIIHKKVGNVSTTKEEIESVSRVFSVSINKTIEAQGVAKSIIYYK
jgi:translation elongation factor EF-1beta